MARRLTRPSLAIATLATAALACQTLVPIRQTPEASTPVPPTPGVVDPTVVPTEAVDRPDSNGRDHGVAHPAADTKQYVELSGEELAVDTTHFRIHYTLTGADAIPDTSSGGGAPSFVTDLGLLENRFQFARHLRGLQD